ncbi:RecQ family ATP-dependent DNA helicase [Saccharomonospora halophila]|uniref:RecQ family ATP-dependent DNA helicase n=1 Tax=Saccharomonospora halophila TaxID=129922 RepID=UPI00037D2740|nr:RecQ family ATP-dependent DNA helicase [Saccharomonospora halophila]
MSPTSRSLDRVAEESFGVAALRPEQRRAMEAVLDGRDVLLVLPSGAGKSLVYQVPTVFLPGPTVVVSPLIALQRDQLGHLADDPDAPEAVAVHSAQPGAESDRALRSVRRGEAEYLFLSPEQLADPRTVDRMRRAEPSLFVVDEAHCVSDWGHDFRPDYLRLRHAVEELGRPPVLAATATASGPVRDDIVGHLGMVDPVRVVTGFDRPNLFLAATRITDDTQRHDIVRDRVLAGPTPGLVYAPTRADTETFAAELAEHGVSVAAFHAGLPAKERRRVQDAFTRGGVDVVVATSAFGMGIDKPDVRFVVHTAPPDSLDSYYQQIGRAGRDGGRAEALLIHRADDFDLQRFLTAGSFDEDKVAEVADTVAEYDGTATPTELDHDVDQSHRSTMGNLGLLERAGIVGTAPDGGLTVTDPDTPPARAAAGQFERRRELDRSRIAVLREYAETAACRRQFLLGYFGERLAHPCGDCDTCAAGTAGAHAPPADDDVEFDVGTRVRHRQWGRGTVATREADRLTVLFDEGGYRTLALSSVRQGGLLTPAGDEGAADDG